MNSSLTVYLFRDNISTIGNTVVCVAEKAQIEAALGKGEIEVLFQGKAVYANDSVKQDYLGVWGARNASRLRRLLRERSVEIVIERTRPPNARLRQTLTVFRPPN